MRVCSFFVLVFGLTVGALAADRPDSTSVIDTDRAWNRVAAAREAAGRDHHGQAARTYLDALAHDARLVPTVAAELAYQKLWREDAQKAIFYFRRYLARHPEDSSRDVRKGLALAYSWSGRQGEAVDLYARLAADDPTDAGAQLGLGRSLIWDNRLHDGGRILRDLETAGPGEGAGREASRLMLKVLDEYDPHLDMRWNATWDSDDLTIHRAAVRGRTNVGNVLVEAGAGTAWYSQPGRPDVSAPQVRLGVIAPLARNWTLHAYGWLDHFTSDAPLTGAEDVDWTSPGADAWLTWLATSRLRLDLGAGSLPVETYTAIARELHQEPVSLSAEWRPGGAWTLAASARRADFSDGNVRRQGSAQLFWRGEGKWETKAGPSFSYMDHDLAYPGGYWSPAWVRNAGLQLAVGRRWQRLTARLAGSVGLEKELGADAVTVGGVSGHVGWRVSSGWLLAFDAGHSRSRFSAASGYNRTSAGLSVRALF